MKIIRILFFLLLVPVLTFSQTENAENPLDELFTIVEEQPGFPGGDEAFMQFIGENLKYPEQALKDSIQGKVYVSFVVRQNGSITDIKTLKGVHPLLDSAAIAVVQKMPRWNPGKQKGKPVSCNFVLPVKFDLPGDMATVKDSSQKEEATPEPDKLTPAEEPPSFPGSDDAFVKYLQENLKYPDLAKEKGIHGTVLVSFVIAADGTITDVMLLHGIGLLCDLEAVRFVRNMPKWNPGKQRGKPIAVRISWPIKFTLKSEE